MAGRNRKLLPLDLLAFHCPLPFDLLGRRRVRTMYPTSWIGTNLDDVSSLASVVTIASAILSQGFWNVDSLARSPFVLAFLICNST